MLDQLNKWGSINKNISFYLWRCLREEKWGGIKSSFGHVKFELPTRYLNGDNDSVKIDIGGFRSEFNGEIKPKILF